METEAVKIEENVDKLVDLVSKLDNGVELAEKIMADGKVNMLDAVYAPELINLAIDLFNHFKDHRAEMLAEIKDIDFAEAITLVKEAGE